jgi:diguanylate cyclase (GGDEF)-like protein/PAS domain S-box-containing protein
MFRVLTCLTGEHDLRLVALAGIVCFVASLTAINLFHRARLTTHRTRAIWIITAGAATGCGIWATHFVAMLAYAPGLPIGYDIGLTALSLVAAISVTSIGIAVAVCVPSQWSGAVGGGIVGTAVASMHYLGMFAVQLPGQIGWALELVASSIILGIVFGAAALALAVRRNDTRATIIAAVLLTLAIVSHHFTAMGAVEVVPDPTRVVNQFSLSPTSLAWAIANAAMAILGMSLASAMADRRLRAKDLQIATAMNNMPQGVVMFDVEERLIVCNNRYIEMYDLSPEVVKPGCTLREVISHRLLAGGLDMDPDRYRTELLEAMAQGRTHSRIVDTADGRAISIINRPIAGGDWVGTHEDITERRKSERELERAKTFLNTVIENVPATIVVKELPEMRYALVNRAGERYFNVERDQMLGKTAADIFPEAVAKAIVTEDEAVLRAGSAIFFDEHPIYSPAGMRFVTANRLPIFENGKPKYLLAVIEDVTARKRAEAQIAHMAHHDTLTDLPNRTAFTQYLAQMFERATTSNESFAVVSVDLDRFKEVNDVFGHAIGDAVLKEIAKRLAAAGEGAFLARLGGDEFIFVVADGVQPVSAEALGNRLLTAVAQDLEIEEHQLQIGLSIGVAIFPADGRDATTLLANADAALYRAKADGRGSMRFFEPKMDERLRERRALQHDLRSALTHNELILHYQPQALIGGAIIGFEALVRWHHPVRGIVSPGTFIPIAEESGTIIQIGEWILREACREAASWPRPLQIAINLSPVQFRQGDLAGLVHSILLETGLAAHRLEFEITEGVLIGDSARALSILRRLKALGVRIAMDDFGTGYSSLSYLQSFPFDKIKIDRAFISNVEKNDQSAAIVRAVIGLGRGLHLPVVAEGVETPDQLEFLLREECDEVQGFLIGRPLPIDHYAEFVGRPTGTQPLRAAAGV